MSRRPGVVSSCQLVVALPLVVPSLRHPLVVLSRQLGVALPLAVLSLRHPLVNLSHQLVVASPPRAALSSSRCANWLLRHLLVLCPLVISWTHCGTSSCLVAPAGCRTIISCRPLIALPSCPLIVLAGCCIACPCSALSSSRRSPSPTPSNAIECCCRHETPPSLPPLNAVSIILLCHSCCPSPSSNTNTHLHPSPLSYLTPAVATRHR